VPIAKEEFDKVLGDKPNQKSKMREEVSVSAKDLLDAKVDGGKITEAGLLNNISVGIQYLDNWLRGIGAAAIYNLMEDAATAEISRAQIWMWITRAEKLDDGRVVTKELYIELREKELARLKESGPGRLDDAAKLLDELALRADFPEFLTLGAYELLS
jgi:malate synthase